MQRSVFRVAFLAFLASAAPKIWAQAPGGSKPASSNVRNAEYPLVSPDGRVTFRVRAPTAQKVEILPLIGLRANGLGKGAYEMTRDSEGFWSVTTPPAVPGLHYYSLVIDGVSVADPSSETFYGANHEMSAIEIPEPGVDFYLPKDVPHGQLRIFWYLSKVTGEWRRVFVYTPPGYDIHPRQRYPVLYLQHGGGENETGWPKQGHVNFILDNLIAAGKASPMIVAMGSGYAVRAGEAPSPVVPASPGRPSQEVSEAVEEVTVKELIPAVDAGFRTIADRSHRAMAGLSMGSVQTLSIGLHHLDTFSALGVLSRPPVEDFNPGTAYGGVMADAASFNKRLHLFWWSAGTAEEGIDTSVKATTAAFDKAGIHYTFVEYPGLSHEWQTWRKSLYDFAPRLFQW